MGFERWVFGSQRFAPCRIKADGAVAMDFLQLFSVDGCAAAPLNYHKAAETTN
jgi:hypothetical protein